MPRSADSFADAIVSDTRYRSLVLRHADIIHSTSPTETDLWIDGWFNGDAWLHHGFSSAVEATRLGVGDIGNRVGTMGEVRWFWRHARPRIVRETLFKLTHILQKVKYAGLFGVRLAPDGVVTVRTGLPPASVGTMERLLEYPYADWLLKVADGARMAKPRWEFAASTLMALVPFPYGEPADWTIVLADASALKLGDLDAAFQQAIADKLIEMTEGESVWYRPDMVTRAKAVIRHALATGVSDALPER